MNITNYQVVADSRIQDVRPLFSVTVAVYDVEEYISATLKSFKRQDISPELVEYIFVDDGSPDRAVDIIRRFAAKQPNVLVVTKPNGGVGETRKLALALARGEWVTAVDPDDLIRFDYFSEAKRFLDSDTEGQISILSSRIFITNGADGTYRDTHPLGAKFRGGNRVVSMLQEPSAIQMGATAFLRLDVLREHGLTFNSEIKPTFEDGNLVCRYLAHFENPVVALLSTSHYYYRKRADSSSLVQSSWQKPERYTVVPRNGYLDALTYVNEQRGYTPDWLANIVLYDLMWYFKEEEKMGSLVARIDPALKSEFMAAAEEIFTYISGDQVLRQPLNKPAWRLREAILRRFNLDTSAARIFRWGLREDGQRNYSLLASPGQHDITVFSGGSPVQVTHEGTTDRIYFDQIFVTEYSFSLPEAPIYFVVDGQRLTHVRNKPAIDMGETDPYLTDITQSIRNFMPYHTRTEKARQRWLVAAGIQNSTVWGIAVQKVCTNIKRKIQQYKSDPDAVLREKVETFIAEGRAKGFENAWLLLDHADRADDNAEHLYRHLMNNEPEINIFFLLSRSSKDWVRLETEGFRLLEYGSVEAMAAARVADIVASSDAVEGCIYPAPRRIFGPPSYKFVFLQHGIIKDDMSRWLNGKKIDLVISSTLDEYQSFTWKNSPYEYKYYNSAMTGLARYDKLYQLAQAKTPKGTSPHTLFIMPTWRQSLRDAMQEAETETQRLQVLTGSDFYKAWWSFLESPELQRKIESEELKVQFMVHPGFGSMLSDVNLPKGVEFLLPSESSFQELIVDADLFLTDYSSLAFDCAYIGTPVAYYQFDRETMFAGGHTYRQGYFDYYRDGLGPVLENHESALEWVNDTLLNDCRNEDRYEFRRRQTYRYLDGNNCARTTEVMKSMVAGNWPMDGCQYISLPAESMSRPPLK
ncbi:CDP-glycerol glycerophosphotransferase family protein [Rothia sp. (in: high G+C Gram-positive bacteria)]|uniref:bifunctional glycosyltransferase/CDP-glycerol:glycerophosphate glycerophosphotransferase n=1 Tax=Rothia sp. (in: high G+C Gram-positive bacteria) TaxID=1885016 RepID=UPI0032163D51